MTEPHGANRPAPIPAPPDFPVTWDNPEDERLFWTRERMHFPDQMSPLTASSLMEAWLPGWRAAAASFELPVADRRARLINTYYYDTMVPLIAPLEESGERGRRMMEKLSAAMARLGDLWDTEWLPEVKRHVAHLAGFDLTGATMPALRAHLEETLRRFKRLLEIHFILGLPVVIAPGLFDELYRDLFAGAGPFDAYRLLQGFDNKTREGDRALWRLSRRALADPEVRAALETCDAAVAPAALDRATAGRAFLGELKAFLAEYGMRADKVGLDSPFWIDDPTPAIENLKDYITQPDRDLVAELAALAAERERLVAEARERLKGYPQPVVGRFELLLAAAQAATVLLEDHTFWLECPAFYHLRRLSLELGRRLAAAGALDTPEDVLFLTLDELRETAAALPRIDRHGLVAERRAERERFRRVAPPPALGTPPPGPPPDTPLSRAIGRFFGTPPRPSGAPGVLRGSAGSPGKARGPAKVVRLLSEADKLQPGDILVAETTMPPWTPLFATAAAVVTDVGGILSHCAVVAREYRIPAVVGVGVATSVIRDGQIVEVDGDAGEVRIDA